MVQLSDHQQNLLERWWKVTTHVVVIDKRVRSSSMVGPYTTMSVAIIHIWNHLDKDTGWRDIYGNPVSQHNMRNNSQPYNHLKYKDFLLPVPFCLLLSRVCAILTFKNKLLSEIIFCSSSTIPKISMRTFEMYRKNQKNIFTKTSFLKLNYTFLLSKQTNWDEGNNLGSFNFG